MDVRDFLTVVRSAIQDHSLLTAGDRAVVALSGGADSCALLLALVECKIQCDLELHVAHLNHRLRGAEADADAAFCRALADRYNLPYHEQAAEVGTLAREQKQSLEETARSARYGFLQTVRSQVGAQRVAVGHTLDDLAETFFLNLFRGSGLDGLVALRPKRDGYLIRPLLDCTHAEAERFCRAHGVVWREDSSNNDQRFRRNRVRHQLLPLIRDRLCPEVLEKVGRLSELLRDDQAELEAQSQELLSKAATSLGPEGVELDGRVLLECSPALARRAVRAAVATVRGNRHNISVEHVNLCLALLRDPRGSRAAPLPGVRCLVEPDRRLLIQPCSQPDRWSGRQSELRTPVRVPGTTRVPELDLELLTEARPAEGSPPRSDSSDHALVDADRSGSELWVRVPRPGDRFQPLGLNGSKKLSDLFIDAKVPRWQRAATPVVENRDHIVWVVGHRIDDRVKVTTQTRQVLRLHAHFASSEPTDGKECS